MKQRKTFNRLLQESAFENRRTLMKKARDANRIAKAVRGANRRRSYDVKVKALKALATKFAADVKIFSDKQTPNMVVVSVVNVGFGLHAPGGMFDLQATN
jgi:hypothetical protein